MGNGSYARKFELGKYCPHFQKSRGKEKQKLQRNYRRLLGTWKAAQYTYQEHRLWSHAAWIQAT